MCRLYAETVERFRAGEDDETARAEAGQATSPRLGNGVAGAPSGVASAEEHGVVHERDRLEQRLRDLVLTPAEPIVPAIFFP